MLGMQDHSSTNAQASKWEENGGLVRVETQVI